MRRLLSAATVLVSLAVAPAAHAWSWPVDGPVLRSFSLADDPYADGQHRGIDVGAAEGEAVRAPTAGTVSFVGAVPNGGRVVTVLTSDGYAVTLLQLGTTVVQRGVGVDEGVVVGSVGPSADGVTTSPHVHIGIRRAGDAEGYVDPESLLPRRAAVTAAPASASPPAALEPAPPVVVAVAPAAAASAPVPVESAASPSEAVVEPAAAVAAPAGARPTPRTEAQPRRSATAVGHVAPSRASSAPPAASRTRLMRHRIGVVDTPSTARVDGATAARPAGSSRPRGAVPPARGTMAQPAREAVPTGALAATGRAGHAIRPMAAPARPPVVASSRPRDGHRPPATAAPANDAVSRRSLLAGLASAVLALAGWLCARRVARRPAPIISGDELLRDHTHLLRERDPAHRARVHDDRRRHPRPAPPAARRGDVLPDRCRRARGQGCAGGRGARPSPQEYVDDDRAPPGASSPRR